MKFREHNSNDAFRARPAKILLFPAALIVLTLALPPIVRAQLAESLPDRVLPQSESFASSAPAKPPYSPPGAKQRFHLFLNDDFGPYPIFRSGLSSTLLQARNSPPDWRQGWDAWGSRFGSQVGRNIFSAGAKNGLAVVFREDAKYYRCDCRGPLPRLKHAFISSFTSRRGADGHRNFSLPLISAPYAGSFAALAWYPDRYDYEDSARMGTYGLLYSIGENIGREFIWEGL